MKSVISCAALILLGVGCHDEARLVVPAPESASVSTTRTLDGRTELRYSYPVGKYFRRVDLYSRGRFIRAFHTDVRWQNVFIKDGEMLASNASQFIVLSEVVLAAQSDPAEVATHEIYYCNIVEASTGCVIARETGQFCSGEFEGSMWVGHINGRLDLREAQAEKCTAPNMGGH